MVTNSSEFQARLRSDLSVTIADGQTVSDAVDTHGTSIIGLAIPSGFDGTALTFQVSNDNSTFYTYRNPSGSIVTMNVVASNAYGIVPGDFAGWRFIKLVAGTAQTGDITIELQTRPL